jgi:membrane protease YdiL (CAAX protease family)
VFQWPRVVSGVFAVFALFHWLAMFLGSDRGQAGGIVAAVVIAAIVAVERLLFGTDLRTACEVLGLGRPAWRGIRHAIAISVVLVSTVGVFTVIAGAPMALAPGWMWLVPGLFAQAGMAEETLFRGFLFGHLRRSRSFWRAATLSMIPFVIVHLLLFLSMPWPIALAALLVAVALSFPFAHLFELGGHTIWAPAVVHAVIQGVPKLVVAGDGWTSVFALGWMLASVLVPTAALLLSRPRGSSRNTSPTASPPPPLYVP